MITKKIFSDEVFFLLNSDPEIGINECILQVQEKYQIEFMDIKRFLSDEILTLLKKNSINLKLIENEDD